MSDKPPSNGRACFYAIILPHAIKAARSCGYALAVHGSLVNDLDLVAVPWVKDARPAEDLVRAVVEAVGGFVPGCMMPGIPMDAACIAGAGHDHPHGRRVWNICWGGRSLIDLGVMPRVAP